MTSTSRRRFLKTAVSAAAGWWGLHDSRSARTAQANERLNLAVVGMGARGSYHVGAVPRVGQNLVAICDADKDRLAVAAKRAPDAAQYQDFRKLLDELDRKLDGLIVATPEHTHAVISARAMTRGKHVYCEKPIAHDVSEARALRRIAKETGVATQMGNQGMATDSFRRTVELVEDGLLGELREAHVWYVFGGGGPRQRPEGSQPVPERLDWDVWLGPARFRPYHLSYEKGWGGWRDFGTGCLGGGGSHSINLAFKAFQLRSLWEPGGKTPNMIRVETEVSERCPDSFPRWQIVRFHIPAHGAIPAATIHWYNAAEAELVRQGIWARLEKIAGRPLEWQDNSWTPRSGTLLVGSKGVVHTNAHNSVCAWLPEGDFSNVAGPPQRLPHVAGHERDWFQACRGGPAAISSFEHSGPAMELLLLGNVASLVDGPLEFDPVAMKIVNNAEADALLRPEHRQGWTVDAA
ncbi:MAG TPA: Gfo/Idh/MocA family oxidoreductase [Candidatus Anammoximicrobium sp.]|nr:Gfo/Idh/MocA family oxidoreductase [Candidatus Anammoximicrobium sp.]